MLFVQASLLRLVGILPLAEGQASGRKVLSVIRMIFAFCILTGALYSTAFQAAIIVAGFFHGIQANDDSRKPKNLDAILPVMGVLPFFTIDGRAFLALILLFIKRRHWNSLMLETNNFMQVCFPSNALDGLIKSIQRIAVTLCALTVLLVILWEFVNWHAYLGSDSNLIKSNHTAHYLPITYHMYQNIIIWVIFSTLPFILSQQVYLCAVILAIILSKAIDRLISQINEERVYYEGKKGTFLVITEKDIEGTEVKVKNWEICRMQSLLFCGSLNKIFSLILFAIYTLDFLTLLGFTSSLMREDGVNVTRSWYLIFGDLVFLSYGTVFLLPLVAVYEKVSHDCL
jgi:hypothetical protein